MKDASAVRNVTMSGAKKKNKKKEVTSAAPMEHAKDVNREETGFKLIEFQKQSRRVAARCE